MQTLHQIAQDVYTIPDFWDTSSCAGLLQELQELRFEEASIGSHRAQMRLKQVRDNDRIIWDHPVLAETLWAQLSSYPLPDFFGASPMGLNERLRIYRYQKGQHFDWHADGRFRRANGEQSLYTFLLYLTDECEGGETAFRDARITPQQGLVCLFAHNKEHKGAEVRKGTKIVLRSDVMYTPLGVGQR